ncbi:MAG: CvpA family protein [Thermoguttaceae bacterium]|jgi:uncharacterized membrane protein required for colicin V production|nr:CvpA family protein [Thermoguttaceae bacterium]
MSFVFPLLLLVILIACIGFLYPEGMWSNAVRFVNVVLAALLAMNFWEPVARLAEEHIHSKLTFFWDYLALWGLFAVFMVVFQLATRRLSEVKVRFLKIADQIGSGAFALAIGYVMVCFTTLSIHLAPLGPTAFFDGFDPEKASFVGLYPDRHWLAFTEWMSKGPYATSSENTFDPQHAFIPRHRDRRYNLDKYRTEKNSFLVAESDLDAVAPP